MSDQYSAPDIDGEAPSATLNQYEKLPTPWHSPFPTNLPGNFRSDFSGDCRTGFNRRLGGRAGRAGVCASEEVSGWVGTLLGARRARARLARYAEDRRQVWV